MTDKPILPGQTIGILGSGQLGRMLAIEARKMGYGVHVFSPSENTPTGHVADREFVAAYDDLDKVRQFAQSVDVVTYEFENVPADTAQVCAEIVPLRPGANVLHVAQNRLREKGFFREQKLPTTPFAEVNSLAELHEAIQRVGEKGVLKTAVSGYDGKGQAKINHASDAEGAWQAIGQQQAIYEGWVEFEREVSVVAGRGLDGSFAHYGLIQNDHYNHILDVSIAPAPAPKQVADQAIAYTQTVLQALDVVGVLCVEFFLQADGSLLLNEIAPRPHNSGHLTFDACVTSQFEQQLRAVCGLPLGDTRYLQPVAMANLLGDLWQNGEPNWLALTEQPINLHLYGKQSARIGRKMGHITAFANSVEEAEQRIRTARKLLSGTKSYF